MNTNTLVRDEKKKFDETVQILVKAYLNDTLQHNNCYACAVGNIIAHSQKYTYSKCQTVYSNNILWQLQWNEMPSIYNCELELKCEHQEENWMNVFRDGEIDFSQYTGKVKSIIDSTGYSAEELMRVEMAFESVDSEDVSNEQWMFNGLMAVVDVLADIHGIDLTTKDKAKSLFVKTH